MTYGKKKIKITRFPAFTAAKVTQLSLLPQGKVERAARVQKTVHAMDESGFGNCSNYGQCEIACPKSTSIQSISHLNREYLKARKKSGI